MKKPVRLLIIVIVLTIAALWYLAKEVSDKEVKKELTKKEQLNEYQRGIKPDVK